MNLRTLLILGRVSNLPTVWSNLLAGWMLNGGGFQLVRLALLLLGGSLLYIGGMYFNDFCDVDFDGRFCPQRPIPSGQISRREVGLLALIWFTTGLWCLVLLGVPATHFGLALVAAIVVYDLWHKAIAWAPLVMGFCRFLLYCLAAAAANSNITPVILQLGAVLGLYVAGITYLARGESKSGKPVYWPMIWLIMPFVVGVETCFVRPADPAYEVLPLLVFGLGQVGWVAWLLDPLWHGTDRSIGRVVSGLLAGIVLVDALLLVPFGGWLGLWVLPFFPLALRLQRVIPAT